MSHPMPPGETGAGLARGLYLITPDMADTAALLAKVAPVLPYATWLQYRNKGADRVLRREQVQALLPKCRAAGVPLIVNDDWRLAAECGAQGAHVGEDDGDLRQAREQLGPQAILGASCYDSLALAEAAVAAGAGYVAFGAFFPSRSKSTHRRASPELLQAAATLGVPRVAIGGISADNALALVAAGADLLAVIGSVFEAPDPAAAAQALQRAFPAP